jgi:hypothetical protein
MHITMQYRVVDLSAGAKTRTQCFDSMHRTIGAFNHRDNSLYIKEFCSQTVHFHVFEGMSFIPDGVQQAKSLYVANESKRLYSD